MGRAKYQEESSTVVLISLGTSWYILQTLLITPKTNYIKEYLLSTYVPGITVSVFNGSTKQGTDWRSLALQPTTTFHSTVIVGHHSPELPQATAQTPFIMLSFPSASALPEGYHYRKSAQLMWREERERFWDKKMPMRVKSQFHLLQEHISYFLEKV